MNASERIDAMIAGITDWRGETFAKMRKIILAADGGIVEEWKYMGSPVWYCDGMIAVANSHKGNYGHVMVIAGSRGKSGAAILASRGALHRWGVFDGAGPEAR